METKKKSVSEYVQEYGAFIALIVLALFKKEMTLDCPFCNPLQSRVISGAPCYLTSCGYLSFY